MTAAEFAQPTAPFSSFNICNCLSALTHVCAHRKGKQAVSRGSLAQPGETFVQKYTPRTRGDVWTRDSIHAPKSENFDRNVWRAGTWRIFHSTYDTHVTRENCILPRRNCIPRERYVVFELFIRPKAR